MRVSRRNDDCKRRGESGSSSGSSLVSVMRKHGVCKKPDTKGFTLVELTVTFALLSIFIVAAAMIITSTMNVYYQAKGTGYGIQISEIIYNKIAQELERAGTSTFQSVQVAGETGAMYLDEETVEFVDEEGRHAVIGLFAKDSGQYLQIGYYLSDGEDAGEVTDVWRLDEKVYMGYSIKSLRFSKASEEFLDNVICVELVLYSPGYGEYAVTKYISCYNFAGAYANRIVQIQQ